MGGEVVGDRGSQERCRELTLSSTLIPSLTGKPPTSSDGSAISTARASVADSRPRRLAIRSICEWTVGRQPLNEASAIEFVATFFLLPGSNITPQSSLHSTTFLGKYKFIIDYVMLHKCIKTVKLYKDTLDRQLSYLFQHQLSLSTRSLQEPTLEEHFYDTTYMHVASSEVHA